VLLRGIGLAGQTGRPPDQNHQYLNLVVIARDRAVAGAVVEVTLDDGQKRRALVDTGVGGYAVGSNQLHFGLGDRTVRSIHVSLPGGTGLDFAGNWANLSLLVDASKEHPAEPQVINPWQRSSATAGDRGEQDAKKLE